MGIKSASTRRTQAASAISGQTVTVHTASGIAVSGAKITPATAITLGVVAPGQTSISSAVTASSGSGSATSANIVGRNLVFGDYI